PPPTLWRPPTESLPRRPARFRPPTTPRRCAPTAGKGRSAPGHMTQDTCGTHDLPTFHMALKAKRTSTKVLKSIKDSCCGNVALRRVECREGRCWNLRHCSSSSQVNALRADFFPPPRV